MTKAATNEDILEAIRTANRYPIHYDKTVIHEIDIPADMSFAEIGSRLGIDKHEAYNIYVRAIKKIRKAL